MIVTHQISSCMKFFASMILFVGQFSIFAFGQTQPSAEPGAEIPVVSPAQRAASIATVPNGLTIPMAKYGLSHTTAQVTPTICELMGVRNPDVCIAKPVPEVMQLAVKAFPGEKVQKVIIFCPDAMGANQIPKYESDFKPLFDASDYVAKCTNVMTSCTPVNFATIFTGTPPEIHGRKVYNKDLIKVQTLFDVLPLAGKKTAIAAQNECSMDKIFRGRNVDYYTSNDCERTFETTAVIIERFDYDVIVCYDGGYDSTMHARGIDAPQSQVAMRNSIRRGLKLFELADTFWSNYNRLCIFAVDHGSHNNAAGKGTHGQDCEDDCVVNHYYRIRAGK